MTAKGGTSFARNALSIFGTHVIRLVLMMVPGILVARTLGPSEYGYLAYVLAIVGILSIALRFGGGPAITHFIGRDELAPERAIGQATAYVTATGTLCLLGIWIYSTIQPTPDGHGLGLASTLCAAGLITLNLFLAFGNNTLLGTAEIRKRNRLELIEVALYCLVIVTTFLVDTISVPAVLLFMLISKLLAAIYLHTQIRPGSVGDYRPDWNTYKKILSFGVAPFAAALLLVLTYRIDVFFIKHFRPPSELGLYSVAVANAERLLLIPTALATATLSRSSNIGAREGATATALLSRVVFATLPALLLCAGVVLAVLIPLLYGEPYRESVRLLFWLLPGIWALGLFQVAHSHLVANNHAALSATVLAVAVGLKTGLNALLVPEHGAIGAAAISSAAYFVAAAMVALVFYRVTGLGAGSLWLITRKDLAYIRERVSSASTRLRGTQQP